jgi:hypothetical protein
MRMTAISLAITRILKTGGNVTGGPIEPEFVPTSLFSNNEEGAFYDFSNLATLRQNSDGTGAVVDFGDPVGFVLDQSKGAGSSGGVFTGLGPELWDETEVPTIDTSSGTTIATYDGAGRFVWGDDGTAGFRPGFTFSNNSAVVGKSYVFTISFTANADSYFNSFRFGDSAVTSIIAGWGAITAGNTYTYTGVMQATAAAGFQLRADGRNGGDITINSLSIRELYSNPLTQATDTARPLLARVPVGGRRNLVNQSNDFSSGYSQVNLTESAGVLSENDSSNIKTFTTISLPHRIQVDGSSQYALSIEIKPEGRSWVALEMRGTGMPVAVSAYYNVSTGETGTINAGADSAAIVDAGGGYYRCSLVGTSNSVGALDFRIYSSDGDGDINTIGLDGPAYSIRNLQIEKASAATPYQQVTAAYDITEEGVDDVVGLLFDGVDDGFITPELDFTGTRAITVATGIERRDADDTSRFCMGNGLGNTTGKFLLASPASSGADDTLFRVNLGATKDVEQPTSSIPASIVARADGAAPYSEININGLLADSQSGTLGADNFGSEVLEIGNTTVVDAFFGFMCAALIIDRYITDEEATELETYLEGKAGVE